MERSSGSQQKDLEQAENAQHSEIGNESESESPSHPQTDALSDLEGLISGMQKNLAKINATDLIRGTQARAAEIDWEEKKREALERARARFATNSWPSAAIPAYPVEISQEITQTLQDFARNPHRESMQKEALECMSDILNSPHWPVARREVAGFMEDASRNPHLASMQKEALECMNGILNNPHWPDAIREVAGFMEDARHNPYLAAMRGETVNPVADAHPNLQEAVGNADSPENQESLPVVERDAHGLEGPTSSSSGPSKNRDHQGKDETRSVEDGLEPPQGSGSSSSYSEPVPYDAPLTEEEKKVKEVKEVIAPAMGRWRHENPHIDSNIAFKPQQSGCTGEYKTHWKGELKGAHKMAMDIIAIENSLFRATSENLAPDPHWTDSLDNFDGGKAAMHLEMTTSLSNTEAKNSLIDQCGAEHVVRSCRNPDSCQISQSDWERIVSAPSGSNRKGAATGGFRKDFSEIYSVGTAGDFNHILGDALSQNLMAQRVQQITLDYEASPDFSDIVNKLVDPLAITEASNNMVRQNMGSFPEADGVTSAAKKIPDTGTNYTLTRFNPRFEK